MRNDGVPRLAKARQSGSLTIAAVAIFSPVLVSRMAWQPSVLDEGATGASTVALPTQVSLHPRSDDAFGDQLAPDQTLGQENAHVARCLVAEACYHRLSVTRLRVGSRWPVHSEKTGVSHVAQDGPDH